MKSTTEIAFLVNRLQQALRRGARDGVAMSAAEEYAEICKEAGDRLAECKRLASSGDLQEAISTAEESPPLLDLTDGLAKFDQAAEWRTFCEEHSLPIPREVDPDGSAWLVRTYRGWSACTDLLWKKYRDATVRRDEDDALGTVHRILKVNGSDKEARDESNRILRRHFRKKLVELEKLVDEGDQSGAVRLAATLEDLPFDDLKTGEAWESTIKLREEEVRRGRTSDVIRILSGIPDLQEAGNLEAVRESVGKARSFVQSYNLDLDEGHENDLEAARTWIREEAKRRKAQAKVQEAVDCCAEELRLIETRWEVLNKSPREELEGTRRKLTNWWREIEKIGAPAPAGMSGAVTAAQQRLDLRIGQLARKEKRQKRLVIGVTSLVLFSGAYFGYAQLRGDWMKTEMARMMKERNALPLEKLERSAHSYRWPIVKLAGLDEEVGKATKWLAKEFAHRDSVTSAITELDGETKATFDRPIEEYHSEIEDIKSNINTAANDLKPGLNETFASLRKRWEGHVEVFVTERQQAREEAVAEGTSILSGMPPLHRMVHDDEWMNRLARSLPTLTSVMETEIPQVIPTRDVKGQAMTLERKLADEIERTRAFKAALASCNEATTFDGYVGALQKLRELRFEGTPERNAAGAILTFPSLEADVVGEVIFPGEKQGWRHFRENSDKPALFPKFVEDSEATILQGLSEDSKLKTLQLIRLRELPGGKSFVEYSNGPLSEKTRRVGNNKIIERTGQFFENGNFTERSYVIRGNRGTRVVSEGPTPESELFFAVRPSSKLMSQSQQFFTASIFDSIDQVFAAKNAHPLYRAFVHIQLGKVLRGRPHEWGAFFVPSVLEDLEQLRKISPVNLASDTWLFTNLHTNRIGPIRNFYSARAGRSYIREFTVNRHLAESVLDGAFGYAGFVGVDGNIVPQAEAENADFLYGRPEPRLPAEAVFRKSDSGWEPLKQVAPMTPLLYFKGDRERLLESAAAQTSIPLATIRAMAVPFFTREPGAVPEEPESAIVEEPTEPSTTEEPALGLPSLPDL